MLEFLLGNALPVDMMGQQALFCLVPSVSRVSCLCPHCHIRWYPSDCNRSVSRVSTVLVEVGRRYEFRVHFCEIDFTLRGQAIVAMFEVLNTVYLGMVGVPVLGLGL